MYKEELYEEGIVMESKDGIAVISIHDPDKCEECSARIYCKPGNSKDRSLTVRDPFGVHPGDKVRVVIKGGKILSASLLLYGFPLILLLAGIFIGMEIFPKNKELYSSILAVGLIMIYALSFFFLSKRKKISSLPEIVFLNSHR
jgi:sigma-E factor negative regulatory protein RseC